MTTKILALIPCRSGSKGIPNKNILPFRGKPLLAHSISHAMESELINRTVVSTDDPKYAEIARRFGGETPFLRPKEISGDLSTDYETFEHALGWFKSNENYVPDICVHLRPTYPIRNVEDIDNIVRFLLANPDVDSVRTLAPAPETPFKMWFRNDDGMLTPAVATDIPDAYNLPRQSLPPVYLQNACIDAVWTRVIVEQKSMTGKKIHGYVMDENFDIDTSRQFELLHERFDGDAVRELLVPGKTDLEKETKTFCFDIDGVVATLVPGNDYAMAEPIKETIAVINRFYEKGHRIILFTARGSSTGVDWRMVTRKQISEWGVKHHELLFGKPAADYYIDDKNMSLNTIRMISETYIAHQQGKWNLKGD